VVELVRLLELAPGEGDPLLDHAARLGCALTEPALQLLDGRRDEDRDRSGHVFLDRQGPFRLELEQRSAAAGTDPVDLGDERPVTVSDVPDPLEEAALGGPALEFFLGEKPVLDSVLLACAAGPRRRRDGGAQRPEARQHERDERPLAGPGRTGYDEDGRPGTNCGRRAQRAPPVAAPTGRRRSSTG